MGEVQTAPKISTRNIQSRKIRRKIALCCGQACVLICGVKNVISRIGKKDETRGKGKMLPYSIAHRHIMERYHILTRYISPKRSMREGLIDFERGRILRPLHPLVLLNVKERNISREVGEQWKNLTVLRRESKFGPWELV